MRKSCELYYETEDGGDGVLTFAELKQVRPFCPNYLKVAGSGQGRPCCGFVTLRHTRKLIIVNGRALAHLGAVYQRCLTAFGSALSNTALERASTKMIVQPTRQIV